MVLRSLWIAPLGSVVTAVIAIFSGFEIFFSTQICLRQIQVHNRRDKGTFSGDSSIYQVSCSVGFKILETFQRWRQTTPGVLHIHAVPQCFGVFM